MVTSQVRSNEVVIFDRDLIKKRRERIAQTYNEHGFLFEWARDQLSDRLLDIARSFESSIHIGSRSPITQHDKIDQITVMDITDQPISKNNALYIQGSEDFLPIKEKSQDLVMSNLSLHSVNDLPGALIQILKSLKADGLFIASLFGGETLHELRDIMAKAELNLYGGISPHVFPFADKPQMGDLLQRAGYNLPVVDSEIITVTYDNLFKLFSDLRGMGEGNTILERSKTPLNRQFFMECARLYQEQYCEEDGRITVSFEIIFILGWSPHSSQQKPLRPGSAKNSLAEALNTTEVKLNEKTKP